LRVKLGALLPTSMGIILDGSGFSVCERPRL
jgi:hypothetical protein